MGVTGLLQGPCHLDQGGPAPSSQRAGAAGQRPGACRSPGSRVVSLVWNPQREGLSLGSRWGQVTSPWGLPRRTWSVLCPGLRWALPHLSCTWAHTPPHRPIQNSSCAPLSPGPHAGAQGCSCVHPRGGEPHGGEPRGGEPRGGEPMGLWRLCAAWLDTHHLHRELGASSREPGAFSLGTPQSPWSRSREAQVAAPAVPSSAHRQRPGAMWICRGPGT